MKVLVGCEESQTVCIEFRKLGIEAYSNDIQECSGGHPEWHLQMDIFEAIALKDWDLGIFFPPCTFLTVSAARWCNVERYGDKAIQRIMDRHDALGFALKLYYSKIPNIAIENPIGYLSSAFRKPDQIIHPYYFGDTEAKTTCLWLKNLPQLPYVKQDSLFEQSTFVEPTYHFTKNGTKYAKRSMIDACKLPKGAERSKFRSKTFPGIAKAMAHTWTNYFKEKYEIRRNDK